MPVYHIVNKYIKSKIEYKNYLKELMFYKMENRSEN